MKNCYDQQIWGRIVRIVGCLFLLASCQESWEDEKKESRSEPPPQRELIDPDVAVYKLKEIYWRGQDRIVPDQEITDLCNSLDIEGCLSILSDTGMDGLQVYDNEEKIYQGSMERFGELDYRFALKDLGAHLPEVFQRKGHSILVTSNSVKGMAAILRGWARVDAKAAHDYALNLAKTEDEFHEIDWDLELSEMAFPSVVEFILEKRLPKESEEIYDSLFIETPFWWSIGALNTYASHCDLSGDKLAEFAKLERLIEHTKRNALKFKKIGLPHGTERSVLLSFAENWSKIDFQGAMDWWVDLERESDDFDRTKRIEGFLRFVVGSMNTYQHAEYFKWMRGNMEVWGGDEFYGYQLANLLPEHLEEVLDLVFALPESSKRAGFLCNLIFDYEEYILLSRNPVISSSKYPEVRKRLEGSAFTENEIRQIDEAFKRAKMKRRKQ